MTDWRSWCVLLAGAGCFGSFAWAAQFHFQRASHVPRGMQAVSVASLLAFAGFLYGVSARPGGFRLAPFTLCVLSLLLFWWCVLHTRRKRFTVAFSPDTPVFLDTEGPYRVARHPFYLAYLMFWVAAALAVPGLLPWAVPAIMAVLYTLAATTEEAKFTDSTLEGDYRAYSRRTGMFFPLLTRQRRSGHEA